MTIPFVSEDFRSALCEALDLEGENVTSIQLTFDMDDLAKAVITKQFDSGQCEKLIRVLKDYGVGEALGDRDDDSLVDCWGVDEQGDHVCVKQGRVVSQHTDYRIGCSVCKAQEASFTKWQKLIESAKA